jgi:hypothetical protein
MSRLGLTALALTIASSAFAGAWPEVGDIFRQETGAVLIVSKVKIQGDVDHSLVCLGAAKAAPCTWKQIGGLKGDWLVYEGVSQR